MKENEIDQIVEALRTRDLTCRSLSVASAANPQACKIGCDADGRPAIKLQSATGEPCKATVTPSLVRLESAASRFNIVPDGATYEVGGVRQWLLPFLPAGIASSLRNWLVSSWKSLPAAK